MPKKRLVIKDAKQPTVYDFICPVKGKITYTKCKMCYTTESRENIEYCNHINTYILK